MINIFRTRILLARNPFLSFKKTTIPSSAVGVRVARRRSLLGELQDVPDDCLQLDPLDVPGDNFRTARSHSMSTASCLQIVLPIVLTISTSIKNSRIEIYYYRSIPKIFRLYSSKSESKKRNVFECGERRSLSSS